jgi:hypothetical protein
LVTPACSARRPDGGEALVHLELLTRPYNVSEPDQVEMYRRGFTNLLAASVTGDEARRLIALAAGDLQEGEREGTG